MSLERRALWLQQAARGVLASLGISYELEGNPPVRGLVVANHLSYLDIAVFSAAMPCFFVAKSEVDRWPIFGKAASSGGTLFLDRSSSASANRVARQITDRLHLPVPVLHFPEGTSTDGSSVHRFYSRLIHPATEAGAPITAAAIRYRAEDGPEGNVPERELCWYGDEEFVTHLWKVLGIRRSSARVQFGEPHVYMDRREAANRTHAEIAAMRTEIRGAMVC
jgi:1-acyl-sn-glycerol-3-phosphate acyltransferase